MTWTSLLLCALNGCLLSIFFMLLVVFLSESLSRKVLSLCKVESTVEMYFKDVVHESAHPVGTLLRLSRVSSLGQPGDSWAFC